MSMIPLKVVSNSHRKVLFDPNTLNLFDFSPESILTRTPLQKAPPVTPLRKGYDAVIYLDMIEGCNLRCTYCLAQDGDYGRGVQRLSMESAQKVRTFLETHYSGKQKILLRFFGGEPTLNFPLFTEVIPLFRESPLDITLYISTNGVYPQGREEEIRSFLGKHFDIINASCDGPPEIQDRQRPMAGSAPTSQKVLNTIQFFTATCPEKLEVTASLSPASLETDFTYRDVARYFYCQGVRLLIMGTPFANPRAQFYSYPELPRLQENLTHLVDWYGTLLNEGQAFILKPTFVYLRQLLYRYSGPQSCGVGQSFFAVSTDEVLYPCHHLMNYPELALGTLSTGIRPELQEFYRDFGSKSFEPCQTCFANPFCRGGCLAMSYHTQRKLVKQDDVLCEYLRHHIEQVCHLYTQLTPDGLATLENLIQKDRGL